MESPKKANGSIPSKEASPTHTKRFPNMQNKEICWLVFVPLNSSPVEYSHEARHHFIKANYDEIFQKSEWSSMDS